jgi:hypothetical protein
MWILSQECAETDSVHNIAIYHKYELYPWMLNIAIYHKYEIWCGYCLRNAQELIRYTTLPYIISMNFIHEYIISMKFDVDIVSGIEPGQYCIYENDVSLYHKYEVNFFINHKYDLRALMFL